MQCSVVAKRTGSFEGVSVELVRRITKTLSRPGRKGDTVSMGGGESFLKASVGSFTPDIREAS